MRSSSLLTVVEWIAPTRQSSDLMGIFMWLTAVRTLYFVTTESPAFPSQRREKPKQPSSRQAKVGCRGLAESRLMLRVISM